MRPPHSAILRRVTLHPGRRLGRKTAIVEVARHGDLPAVLIDPRSEQGAVMAGMWLLGGRDATLGSDAYGLLDPSPAD